MSKLDYKSAGVDIDAGNEAVERIKGSVRSTFTSSVLINLGGFGSLPGAIVGGIILGIIETVSMGTLSFYFSWIKEINDIIVWIVLIVVLMIKPDGLMGVAKVKRV